MDANAILEHQRLLCSRYVQSHNDLMKSYVEVWNTQRRKLWSDQYDTDRLRTRLEYIESEIKTWAENIAKTAAQKEQLRNIFAYDPYYPAVPPPAPIDFKPPLISMDVFGFGSGEPYQRRRKNTNSKRASSNPKRRKNGVETSENALECTLHALPAESTMSQIMPIPNFLLQRQSLFSQLSTGLKLHQLKTASIPETVTEGGSARVNTTPVSPSVYESGSESSDVFLVSNAMEPAVTVSNAMEPAVTVSNAMEPAVTVSNAMEPAVTVSNAMEPAVTVPNGMEPTGVVSNAMEPAVTVSNAMEPTGVVSNAKGSTEVYLTS